MLIDMLTTSLSLYLSSIQVSSAYDVLHLAANEQRLELVGKTVGAMRSLQQIIQDLSAVSTEHHNIVKE